MDKPIKETPKLSDETSKLMNDAEKIYFENFNADGWFGRCIFLSWYCERGTCDFCFRSTQKHKIKNPSTARRSLTSVLAEATIIAGMNWRLEFLTGGYGIYPFEEIVEITKLCSQILGKKMWLNLGVMDENQLVQLQPYVKGIVSSMETLEPNLHNKVCPDKPMEPYFEMMKTAKKMGFKQSFTLVIGIGEKKSDFEYTKKLISNYGFDRVTVYALRPVANTPYTSGPTTEEMVWWISKIRKEFPKIEIIAGTAIYRVPEISLLLKAGANAFTKLPATNMFNTKDAFAVEDEVKKANRNFISHFTCENLNELVDWDAIINRADLTEKQKIEVKETLNRYLINMQDKLSKLKKKK
jgi:biotin synthase-like enzyme